MDYLHKMHSVPLHKAVSELQEEFAKEKNVPVSTFVWRVWNDCRIGWKSHNMAPYLSRNISGY